MKWSEFKAHLPWFMANMSDDEPLVFPRRQAKKRIANREHRKRIIFDTDPLGYQRFHARREAWLLELADNPTLFAEALDKAMETFDVRGFLEQRAEQDMDKSNAL